MKELLLAIDQGTTSSRAVCFDTSGKVRSLAQKEFTQIYPQPGHVEHNPEELWESQRLTAKTAIEQAPGGASSIAGIGITNQRETTIVWEKATGKPVANAIVWQSRITSSICQQMKDEGLEPTIRERTGLVIDPYFSSSKLKYLLDNIDGLRERAERGEVLFGTVDTFFIWRLTGGKVHATDPSNASRTMLFNLQTLDWDEELLRIFGVPRAMLPEVKSSSEIMGETDPVVLGYRLPIAGCAGDQQAASFGHACFTPGESKNTYGTGCFLLMNTGSKPVLSQHGLLTTVAWKIGKVATYCMEGAIFIGGAAIQWLRDSLHLIEGSAESERMAMGVPDTGGVYLVPAFTGLGAPYWEADARGTIVGITRGTTREHLTRAALESIAWQTLDVVKAMEEDAGTPLKVLKVDGGASANDFLMQFQSDVLNCHVKRPQVTETTAWGAACLAGLALGVFSSPDDVRNAWHLDREFTPRMEGEERSTLHAGWKRAVACTQSWARSK